ncbi:DUF4145 domain-containing protein [Microbacterium hatanonis]
MYRVEFVRPALPLLRTPPTTPESVKAETASAGKLIFQAPGTAGNRLRRAVEELMDAHSVGKTKTDGRTGKRSPGSLHARIQDFGVTHPSEAECFSR